jgi:hypothetical protein
MTPCYVTQTMLGSWFGLSSQAVGKILAARGLKDRTGATQEALLGGFARQVSTRDGIPFYTWDAHRVAPIIDEALGVSAPTPYIDTLARQVGEALAEAEGHRAAGSEFVADLITDGAYEDLPPGLVGLIKRRLGQPTTCPA